MKKKFLTMALALCLTMSLTVPAFAADGDVPTTPDGSSLLAEVTYDGDNFSTVGDHDDAAGAADTNGTDITVWFKTVSAEEHSTDIVYKIDVAWGYMKFEYDRGAATWDPDTHTYTGDSAGAKWTDASVDGDNNMITVTNHSNTAIDAMFAATLTYDFNDEGDANPVVANFFDTPERAQAAAAAASNDVTDKLTDSKVMLDTAEAFSLDGVPDTAANWRAAGVYIALSGVPKATVAETNYATAGNVLVTFAPNETRNAEYIHE